MPIPATLERFVDLVESGQSIAAIENSRAADSMIQENEAVSCVTTLYEK